MVLHAQIPFPCCQELALLQGSWVDRKGISMPEPGRLDGLGNTAKHGVHLGRAIRKTSWVSGLGGGRASECSQR